MVAFVHDDDVEIVRRVTFKGGTRQRLNGRKNSLVIFGLFAAGQELTEITFKHDVAESAARLVKNFFSVRNKKQLQLFAVLLAESPVIQGREHGLAGAGCGHGEVAVTTLRTSVLHFFKHAHLMRERVHIQQRRVDIVLQALAFTAGNIRLG